MSLRTKLLLLSLALIVVPGAVFALLAAGDTTRALERAVGQQLASVANDAAQDLADELEELGHEVQGWARQDVMREVIVGDVDKRISRLLQGLHEHDPMFVDLLVSDPKGQVVAAADPALIGTALPGDVWRRALAAGGLVTTEPHPSPHRPRVVVDFATPIHDPEDADATSGVLVASYDWKGATASFDDTRRFLATLGLAVELVVLDENAHVVGGSWHDTHFALGQDLTAIRPRGQRHTVEPRLEALVGSATLAPPAPSWSVLAIQPRAGALAAVRRMNRRFLVTLLAVVLAGILVSTVLADRIVRPVRLLTHATSELTRTPGELPAIPIHSHDEIGQLTGAFNAMAADLTRARDELVAAARLASVGEVAASIAHEVRTPLGILRGSAQMLGRALGDDDPRRRELIAMIVDETDRIERVVAGLTELGRPQQPATEPVALAPLLERAAAFVEGEAEASGVEITRQLAPASMARCDPAQIYQVALNLLVNALQAQPTGGAIRLRTDRGRSGRVAFEVSDDGPGIPPEIRPHIFTPFFTSREGGTGLGLAVVERIVRAHRGTVSVETASGGGTTFRIELPAEEAA